MAATRLDNKFFASTRGQIILLLRRTTRTVEELAQILGLTDNAVRAHLAALERDGLIEQSGSKRGSGKPAFTYDLSAEAESLFPKPYSVVLGSLLDVLSEEMPPQKLENLLKATAQRLAEAYKKPTGNIPARLEAGTRLLNELGGLAELKETEGNYIIRGFSCPLAAVVTGHPQLCKLAETLLNEYTGLPLQENCERNDRLNCTFILNNK
ncbi:MAG TPA: ArsR family transcriptional regulator [Chloroflexia bacterium]|nr:ArsR family transcriptional regulator [Chloroflexia bacterium]